MKLEDKILGPFPIVAKVGDSYRLELYPIMKIENVFHPKYLRKTPNNLLPGHVQPPAPPVIIDREEEHEVDDILDSKREYGRLKYRVQRKGSRVRDLIQYNADDSEFDNAKEIVNDFHRRNSGKEGPRAIGRRLGRTKRGLV